MLFLSGPCSLPGPLYEAVWGFTIVIDLGALKAMHNIACIISTSTNIKDDDRGSKGPNDSPAEVTALITVNMMDAARELMNGRSLCLDPILPSVSHYYTGESSTDS